MGYMAYSASTTITPRTRWNESQGIVAHLSPAGPPSRLPSPTRLEELSRVGEFVKSSPPLNLFRDGQCAGEPLFPMLDCRFPAPGERRRLPLRLVHGSGKRE
jgi:hypothetical protein